MAGPTAVAVAPHEPASGALAQLLMPRRQRALPPPHMPAFLRAGRGTAAAGPGCNPFACPAEASMAAVCPSAARPSGNPFAAPWQPGLWTGGDRTLWCPAPEFGTAGCVLDGNPGSSCAGSAARCLPACARAQAGLQALGNPFSMPAAGGPSCWAARARGGRCALEDPEGCALAAPGSQADDHEPCRRTPREVATAAGCQALGSPVGGLAGEVATMEAALLEFRALRTAAAAAAAQVARLRAAAADAGAPDAAQAAAGAFGGRALRVCGATIDAGSRAAVKAEEARAEQLRAALALRRPALESIAARLRELGL